VEVVASLSQVRTATAQCGLFTHKSVPVIFEPPCIYGYVVRLIVYIYLWHSTYIFQCSIGHITIHYYYILNEVQNFTTKRRGSNI